MKEFLEKLIPGLSAAAAVIAILYGIHQDGYHRGMRHTQSQWDLDKAAARQAYDELVEIYMQKEIAHRAESARITHELAEAQRENEVALAQQRAAFEQRLLQSSRRAEVYQRQAEAGAVECRDLAGHAARLDRALEEGRGLVQELGSTLGLRDQQLTRLGEQILSDRQLIVGDANE